MNDTHGMVRRKDPHTSEAAAAKVDKTRIRDIVERWAFGAGPDGFVDSDLLEALPGAPESSARKRRNELTADGIILDTGKTRMNAHNCSAKIWVHRDHVQCGSSVYIGSAASRPLSEHGLREAVALAHKRTASAALKVTRAQQELADAREAEAEAERTLEGWLTRDQMRLI